MYLSLLQLSMQNHWIYKWKSKIYYFYSLWFHPTSTQAHDQQLSSEHANHYITNTVVYRHKASKIFYFQLKKIFTHDENCFTIYQQSHQFSIYIIKLVDSYPHTLEHWTKILKVQCQNGKIINNHFQFFYIGSWSSFCPKFMKLWQFEWVSK